MADRQNGGSSKSMCTTQRREMIGEDILSSVNGKDDKTKSRIRENNKENKQQQQQIMNKKNLSRSEMLAIWREQKGKTRKENCHPLLSRKRPLSLVVSSPSYIKPKINLSKVNKTISTKNKRRCTFVVDPNRKEKINNDLETKRREKRKTIHCIQPIKLTSPKGLTPKDSRRRYSGTDFAKTPWKNDVLNQRERLDLWLAAKGKTPCPTPQNIKKRKSNYGSKSPHPAKGSKSKSTRIPILSTIPPVINIVEQDNRGSTNNTDNEMTLLKDLEKQLQILTNAEEKSIEEVQMKLDDLLYKNRNVVHLSDYWICRSRLAARDNDVQRVICLLEQAYTFEAKPEGKIKEEICAFLQSLESEESKCEGENLFHGAKFAITPGRRVHFAMADSPVDFKSSIIRFCIVESKVFKRRLNAQLKKKVMTPVRRSTRLRRSDIPEYLRCDNRIIDSPTQVEDDIIDGNIGFVPNKVLNTPLNRGWLISEKEGVDEEPLELSFT